MGDKQAYYSQVFNNHFAGTYRYCLYKLGNREQAEDIASETFTKFLAQADFVPGKEKHWLIKVARNLIYRKYRHEQGANFMSDTESTYATYPDEEETPIEQTLITTELTELVKQQLDQLDDATREVIILKLWEDYNFKAIADLLGLKESAIKLRYYRGLEKIKLTLSHDKLIKRKYALSLPLIATAINQTGNLAWFQPQPQYLTQLLNSLNLFTMTSTNTAAITATASGSATVTKAAIITILATATIMPLAGGIAYGILKQNKPEQTNQQQPESSPTEANQPENKTGENKQQPETVLPLHLIYGNYLYDNRDKAEAYLFNSNAGTKSTINIGYSAPQIGEPRTSYYTTSPNGKYLLRWDNKSIKLSESRALGSFTDLVELSSPIDDLIWSSDSKQVAYSVNKGLYVLNISDKKVEKLSKFKLPSKLNTNYTFTFLEFRAGSDTILLDLNSENTKDTNGGSYHDRYWIINSKTGDLSKEIDFDLPYPALAYFNQDYSKAYFASTHTTAEQSIFEYDVIAGTKKEIYKVAKINSDSFGNKTRIGKFVLAPDGEKLYFGLDDYPGYLSYVFVIDLATGSTTRLLEDKDKLGLTVKDISPDGRYLILDSATVNCSTQGTIVCNVGEYYLLDTATRKITAIEKFTKYQNIPNNIIARGELEVIGWVTQ